ncbi:hypothetical protein [Zophobihabitans entericus]|uniref:Uncharacterized protein n=1 Tax=Zophobihabitans entericus TaxID=1635327 RepID=A0A6G9IAV1_9GAMM|nr:hypothetical protein [Zophobihabitans entericus]QIQ21343.1 hypothetical protein IPMB12_06355 [Zophobihabitans entericus]
MTYLQFLNWLEELAEQGKLFSLIEHHDTIIIKTNKRQTFSFSHTDAKEQSNIDHFVKELKFALGEL